MKKRIINDLDYFVILELKKKKNIIGLKSLQEAMIKTWGNEKCELHSDLEEYNHKKPIKFPFVKE